MKLTCIQCDLSTDIPDGLVVRGQPVAAWWASVGQLCAACRASGPILGPEFAGSDYDHDFDHARLTGQLSRIFAVMQDHEYRTLSEIADTTGDPGPSILAQLGHLRKARFGAYSVTKQPRGDRSIGLWEYRVGAKGTHVPKRHPLAVRAELAEARVRELVAALREVAPDHPLLHS